LGDGDLIVQITKLQHMAFIREPNDKSVATRYLNQFRIIIVPRRFARVE
jgi:hypothetical protein